MSDNDSDQALDSAIPWVAEHTQRCVDTGGADGHIWYWPDGSFEQGVPCPVLFTLGQATVVSADEKERLWPRLVEAWPDYERYRAKTDREIPVVRLRRV